MEIRPLLSFFFAFFMVAQSLANPITAIRKRGIPLVVTQERLDELHGTYKGIWFGDAAKECSKQQFDTLTSVLDTTVKVLDLNGKHPVHKTAGWNRYFVQNHEVTNPGDNGWSSKKFKANPLMNALYNFNQVIKFPKQGKGEETEEGKYKRAGRVTFTCKYNMDFGRTNRCNEPGVGGVTFKAHFTNKGNVIQFCPLFFSPDMKTIAQFIRGGKKKDTQIKEILTKEYIMAHEFFHCEDAAETMGYVVDVHAIIPTETKTKTGVYGGDRTAKWAWKNFYQGSWPGLEIEVGKSVNVKTIENADNFAWLLIFNYFHYWWSWTTNGAWKWPKDELKRGIVQARTDNSTVPQDFEQNPDLAVDEDDINLDNLETPKWCHQVGSDPENIQCTYNAGSSNSASITATPSATKTPASSTSSTKLTPTPTATQKCRVHIWEESKIPTDLDQTMYAKFTVYDGADKQVYNNDDWQKLQWGGSFNINQDDTGLAHDFTVTFKKKDAYENTDANYQKRIFDVNYGTTSWRSDQAGSYDDMNSFPFCGVGEWDQAGGELTSEVRDGPQLLPNRQSDCYFKC